LTAVFSEEVLLSVALEIKNAHSQTIPDLGAFHPCSHHPAVFFPSSICLPPPGTEVEVSSQHTSDAALTSALSAYAGKE